MRENRLVWFAVILAVAALINAVALGYFGLHNHDDFLEMDANNTAKIEPYWNDDGTIQWNDTTYSSTVPFTQGMTIMPGQSATVEVGWYFDDGTVDYEMTPDEYRD